MKIANSIIIPALCWTARLAAATSAHVYIHDPQSEPRTGAQSRSLQPVPARLVLAQRAGVEDYHISDLSRPEAIEAINDFGVRTPLFETADRSIKKAFILLEGQNSGDASLDTSSSFDITPAPESRSLFIDLAKQSDPTRLAHQSEEAMLDLLRDSKSTFANGDMFYIAQSLADAKQLVDRLIANQKWSITALLTPTIEGTTPSHEKKFQWGSYQMPGRQAPLRKRHQKKDEEGWSIYEQGKEAPLTDSQASTGAVQPFTDPVAAFANNTTPLRGILPSCFSTQSACESATRNCTGHGSCMKKYHDRTTGDKGSDCFACACQLTKNNGRTTHWGGPACQKKDISIEFWLIVLFTVGMIFLIGFAVGSVWEMGQQELPSVIGAGVSGPTARK